MARRAKALATRLSANGEGDDQGKIRQAFVWLFARQPTDDELTVGESFLNACRTTTEGNRLTPWEQYALALLGTNEFSYVD
jgi:hypothetical protein